MMSGNTVMQVIVMLFLLSELILCLCTAALQKFRGDDDVADDIDEMKRESREQQREPAWSLAKLFSSQPHKIPLMLVSVLAVCQQLSGINMVFYYSDNVFKSAGIPVEYTQYATLGMGIINVIMTIISVSYIKGGRESDSCIMLTTFPQCNFSLEFPEILSQNHIISLTECVLDFQ